MRRNLLPLWIKVFIWIFGILSFVAIVNILFRISGVAYPIALFGFKSRDPISHNGIIITSLFIFKGVVAYSLWHGEKQGIDLAIFDALISLFICVCQSLYDIIDDNYLIRLELIIIIPYLIKLLNIRSNWVASTD